MPTSDGGWRSEIASAFVAARATLAAGDKAGDEELWHHMEDRAVALARQARDLPALDGSPEDIDRTIDAITDLTERLRRYGGGDPDDHHIAEMQFFLLYYLAAQVHGQALDEAAAGAVVAACWDDCANDDEDEADDGDDEDEAPWPIQRQPPFGPAAWLSEVQDAWRDAARPPALRSAEGKPVVAASGNLREAGVILALHRRGCTPPAEGVYGLIGVISEMEEDIAHLGPELTALKRNPVMAFVLYYVWTHILIGHADEDIAMAVVQHAATHLDGFERDAAAQRSGSARFRRRN